MVKKSLYLVNIVCERPLRRRRQGKKIQSKITSLHSLEISETRSIFNLMIFCVPKVYLQNTTKAEREARLQGAFNWDYSNLAFSVNTHTSKPWILFYFFLIHSDSSGERK